MPAPIISHFWCHVRPVRQLAVRRPYMPEPYQMALPDAVLVLGFYDRGNAGDEMFKVAIPRALGRAAFDDMGFVQPDAHRQDGGINRGVRFDFACIDDVESIDVREYPMVIFGGGDIVNPYFMVKAEQLLARYTGRAYAFSVGVPYIDDARFLRMFDHVFARSTEDYSVAVGALGSRNVTRVPDATMVLALDAPGGAADARPSATAPVRLGVALAQPAFRGNPRAGALLDAIADALAAQDAGPEGRVEVHLLTFNYFEASPGECDLEVNAAMADRLAARGVACVFPRDLADPTRIYDYLARSVDAVLAMRYHSLIFAISLAKPVVALYCSPKIARAVSDWRSVIDGAYQLDTDAGGRPTSCSATRLADELGRVMQLRRLGAPSAARFDAVAYGVADVFSAASRLMFDACRQAEVLVRPRLCFGATAATATLGDALAACRGALAKYLALSDAQCEAALGRRASFDVGARTAEGVARLVCYCVTRSMNSPYVWGLADNMRLPGFCLREAVAYIWSRECAAAAGRSAPRPAEVYYPQLLLQQGGGRRVFADVDQLFNNSFDGFHRSGWAYVVGGMMDRFDARSRLRVADVALDTYVDRTFHWGNDALSVLGLLPYTRPWVGIVHHTFDTTHSSYNCRQLFSRPHFVESLRCCRGLVALTRHLADGLRRSLADAGFDRVPVHAICHPMETVSDMFTMDRFLRNPRRRLVQVGAWLRNPYSIYELPLPPRANPMRLTKTALKGREMDQYFEPPQMMSALRHALLPSTAPQPENGGGGGCCRPEDGGCCRPEDGGCCRPEDGGCCRPENGGCCRDPTANNKLAAGIYGSLVRNLASVEVLDRLENDAYDALLAENVVFLDLVDCSAVNTVLECIVRHTPLIVNRHPALEEVLGADYPGFYEDLFDAACMARDVGRVAAMHEHLMGLDKTQLQLATFLLRLEDALVQAAAPEE